MSKNEIEYNWSDAWLLLAVVYAGKGGATLDRIIAAGDGINHAIFKPDELESGLTRLTLGGYLKEKNGIFFPTVKVMRAYAKTTSPRRGMLNELKDIQELIGAASPTSEQPCANNLKYAGFSTAAYDEAVNKYRAGVR